MVFSVSLLELTGLQVSVDFRGPDIRVPEELLDLAQTGASGEQVRGKAMAESVW